MNKPLRKLNTPFFGVVVGAFLAVAVSMIEVDKLKEWTDKMDAEPPARDFDKIV